MPSVLITDADCDLGPELVRQYAADGFEVFAACRGRNSPYWPNQGITVLHYDEADPAAATQLAGKIGDVPLDIAIMYATAAKGRDVFVADISRSDWIAAITSGTFAPAKLAIALRSNIERSKMKKIIGISSFSASIGGCHSPQSYAFRASKAALNSLWRTFSVEWRSLGICCFTVATDQSGSKRADGQPAELASQLRRLIDQSSLKDSGQFFDTDGTTIPW